MDSNPNLDDPRIRARLGITARRSPASLDFRAAGLPRPGWYHERVVSQEKHGDDYIYTKGRHNKWQYRYRVRGTEYGPPILISDSVKPVYMQGVSEESEEMADDSPTSISGDNVATVDAEASDLTTTHGDSVDTNSTSAPLPRENESTLDQGHVNAHSEPDTIGSSSSSLQATPTVDDSSRESSVSVVPEGDHSVSNEAEPQRMDVDSGNQSNLTMESEHETQFGNSGHSSPNPGPRLRGPGSSGGFLGIDPYKSEARENYVDSTDDSDFESESECEPEDQPEAEAEVEMEGQVEGEAEEGQNAEVSDQMDWSPPLLPTGRRTEVLTRAPARLCYRSGGSIGKGDLVLRLRCKPTASVGRFILDSHDIYDGPWMIIELPDITSEKEEELQGQYQAGTTSSEVGEGPNQGQFVVPRRMDRGLTSELIPHPRMTREQEKLAQQARRRQRRALWETKVKLKFPEDSRADPWTEICRLIPSTYISDTGDESGMRCEFQLSDHVRVAVPYVTSEGPVGDNGTFVVQKLRGKRLRLLEAREARGIRSDLEDNWVRIYRLSGGEIRPGQVLAVEFLVHWAGWPSEDDSWEPAQALPQIFKDEFHAMTDGWRNYDVERDGKMENLGVLFWSEDFWLRVLRYVLEPRS